MWNALLTTFIEPVEADKIALIFDKNTKTMLIEIPGTKVRASMSFDVLLSSAAVVINATMARALNDILG